MPAQEIPPDRLLKVLVCSLVATTAPRSSHVFFFFFFTKKRVKVAIKKYMGHDVHTDFFNVVSCIFVLILDQVFDGEIHTGLSETSFSTARLKKKSFFFIMIF